MRLLLAVLLLLLLPGGVAAAQDADTGGVPRADADAACAAAVGDESDPAAVERFRAAYNTTDNTDDGPMSEGVSPEMQNLVYQQEMHRDWTGEAFTCEAGVAVFVVEQPQPQPEPEQCEADEVRNADGECETRQDAVFETCDEVLAALDAGTLLPEQFPIQILDGPLCELPAEPTPTPEPTPATTESPAPDLNCPDFPLADGTTAQQALDADPADPHGLDEDTDGQACETDLGVIPADPTKATPVQELAYTGASIGWLLGGGAALLALGVGALWFARRRGAEIH